jgi:hypothetical protein
MKWWLVLFAGLASSGLHALVGWELALIVPVCCTFFVTERAWLQGLVITVFAWCVLMLANYVLAPEPMVRLLPTLAGFINAPAALLPVASMLLAALVGTLAGVLGASLRQLLARQG